MSINPDKYHPNRHIYQGRYIRPRRNDRGMCPRAGNVSLIDKAPIKALLKYRYLDLVLKLLSHNCKQELVE